jgi:oligopeptide transport system permease protein
MLTYILRRLLIAIPTLFLVITLTFFLMRAAPGGPFTQARKLPPESEKNVAAKYGMDKPLLVQFGDYLVDIAHGDFGPSLKYLNRPVVEIVKTGLPVSVTLGLASLILALIIGVTLGSLAAVRHNRPTDYAVSALAVLGVCVPTFVTAPLLILLVGTKLGWLPIAGLEAGMKSYILPVLVLTLPQIAAISRLTRAGMIESLHSNYVRTARAKGLPEWRVVLKHALRPSILPLVSYFGPACAGIVTGSLIVERIFRLPGLGKQFYTAALQRDYTLVMAVVILYATTLLILNLVGDILHALLDPKVRLS